MKTRSQQLKVKEEPTQVKEEPTQVKEKAIKQKPISIKKWTFENGRHTQYPLIVNDTELALLGLTKDSTENNKCIVKRALLVDDEPYLPRHKNKTYYEWVVAQIGYYWEYCYEKKYYNFEWYEKRINK